jgi:hypothetical protein
MPCAELPAPPSGESVDDWQAWQADVIRQYGECALRK